MFAVFATVFCLMSVSHSAPLACENLTRPLDQLAPHQLEGRWALVAGSSTDDNDVKILKGRESVSFDYHNSTYTQTNSYEMQCQYVSRNISLEGSTFYMEASFFNFTGTFFSTSCQDCGVFRLETKAPGYASVEFYLVSRRREVKQEEMEEFKAQVECLKLPPPIMMDPTKELCPELATSVPAAPAEEETEGEKA